MFHVVYIKIVFNASCVVPGGSVSMDGETPKTNTCIFNASEDMESMRNFEQVTLTPLITI